MFRTDSKFGGAFDRSDRAAARAAESPHADEIDKVAIWAEAVAAGVGLDLRLPAPL